MTRKLSLRYFLVVSILAVTLVTVLAEGALAQGKLSIGAILYARDSQYWQQVELGMKDAANKYGVNLQVGLNNRQLPTEAQVVDDMVTRGVQVIAVSVLDKDASAAVLKRAKEKGILIVEYNTFLADKSIASHSVGVDNKELAAAVGKEMRNYIQKQLGGKAKIGLITLPLMNPGSPVRKAGVLSALEGLDIKIVAELEGATPEQGANGLEQIIQRDPSTQLIWTSNSGSIAGAVAAARRLKSNTKLYGIDFSKQLADMMLEPDSNLMAVSDQQPYQIGFLAVETSVKAKKGEKVERDITVPVKVYLKEKPDEINKYLKMLESLGK